MTHLRRGEKISEVLVNELTENLMPTRCDKIRLIRDQAFESKHFAEDLKDLEDAARRESFEDIYRILREMNIGFRTEEERRASSKSQVIRSATAAAM
jgi:FlaA1/EpsC-like NDP-sugar epimerase